MSATTAGYSLENAARFGWNSLDGDLLPERAELLRRYVVGSTVLDAGCGGGGFVDYLCRQGYDATGMDRFDMFLGVAEKRGFKGRFLQADLTDRLPFPDKAFDTTICLDVLEHVADDYAALRELARVTRKRIVVTVPQEDRWMAPYRLVLATYRDPTHLRYYTPERLCELCMSVSPAKAEVFGEQLVPIAHLARTMIQPAGRNPLLTRAYRWLFKFLVVRSPVPDVYMNLAAVIDLEPAGAA
jgi:SAM-dependent methyltransferase